MTIEKYIPTIGKIDIKGVPFECTDVNIPEYREKDVTEETYFNDDFLYNFLERLEKAKEELSEFVKNGDTLETVFERFKEETEEGNINYWGCWFSAYTHDEPDGVILFDVRMD